MGEQKVSSTGLERRYRKGAVVEVRVLHLEPHGAIARLDDGTNGIIRTRELTWDEEPEHPREILAEGQTVRAMVLGIDRARPRLNLSLRQAQRDPWREIGHWYKVEQEVCGKVVNLHHSGAFVELERAVDAFLPLHEICSPPPNKIDEVLWIGDTVEGVITRVDHQERHIELSVRQHLLNLERKRRASIQHDPPETKSAAITSLAERLSEPQRLALLNFLIEHRNASPTDREAKSDPHAELAERLAKVLVADNDGGFRASLQHLLAQLGHTVEAVDTAEKAVAICAEKEFDLVLLDLSFTPGRMDGLQATRNILAVRSQVPIVIITGVDLSERHKTILKDAQEAGARGVLLKPVDLSALYRAMTAIVEGDVDWPETEIADLTAVKTTSLDLVSGLPLARKHLQESIRQELAELQHNTEATACVLFQMSQATRQVRVFAHRGAALIGYEAHKYNLQASPVDEVIRLGKEVHEADTSRNPQRFQHLNLLNFSSCIGVPVRTFGQTEYGLFVFHPQKRHFTSAHLRHTNVTAKSIGAIMAREEAERIIQKVQPFVFAGQIGSTLVHELNNRLGSVVNYAQTLNMVHEEIQNNVSKAIDPKIREKMQSCIENLQEDSQKLEEITRLYKGLISTEHRELVSINDVIQRALDVLKFTAEENRVIVLTHFEKDLPSTLAVRVWLEQIFVNVALNAIQHIHLAKRRGEMVIESHFANHHGDLPIQVRFTDTGPGIHGPHQERIFELGFSTRPEGTGLGLFTTRWLTEAMGGRISVDRSVMLVGTTFLVELPLLMPFVERAER